jgi:hypothetical protein
MYKAKAYSAASETSPLAGTMIARRDLTEHDVQIEILFCGICHSDPRLSRPSRAPRRANSCGSTRQAELPPAARGVSNSQAGEPRSLGKVLLNTERNRPEILWVLGRHDGQR